MYICVYICTFTYISYLHISSHTGPLSFFRPCVPSCIVFVCVFLLLSVALACLVSLIFFSLSKNVTPDTQYTPDTAILS